MKHRLHFQLEKTTWYYRKANPSQPLGSAILAQGWSQERPCAEDDELVIVGTCDACVAIPRAEMEQYLSGMRLVLFATLLTLPLLFVPLLLLS